MTQSLIQPAGLTVDELAARAGVTVRTLRFYSSKGLLPPPVLGPRRVGLYGPEHLARLSLIEELQHQGLTLAAIERYLLQLPADITAEDLAMHRALVAAWVPDSAEETPRAQLERRAGRALTDHDVDRLSAMGVLDRTDRPEVFLVNPAMLHLGVRLLDVPIPLETVLATREIVLKHTRAVAHELQKLFREQVWQPYLDGDPSPEETARMRSLTEYIQPALVQALVTAFQRSLAEELRASASSGRD
ncbi:MULTISPECIES: MerR family transcriptional regulator [unclassified Streptomyces]|uniref:MerR family transcriptional regulator n=1 Tax=unclassified Streptomyces TaxID=2593676 RepID=UPI00203330A9|nr:MULTISPECIES: MerR family transcriptional regulator [unclassified Streptomyces]MCM2423371.1 MerR family transcriptional regulator [Streptomyces sp. RKAG293]MCM2424416.1 MerR family transcriptional regulator [Streptomyces sp. RKAG337]